MTNSQLLNKDGVEEFSYMINEKAKHFPTYNCPFKSDMCYLSQKSINDRYKNRAICLECKKITLKEIEDIQ